MYNSDTPLRAELPSSRQLVRATFVAAIAALVLLVAVVLPAEYGIDPTGAGRILGLTDMGEIKKQLAVEAAADAAPSTPVLATGAAGAATNSAAAPAVAAPVAAPKEPAHTPGWRDEIPFTLSPGEGTEIKLTMAQGARAHFAWEVEGGAVNFDTHGDAPGKSISYEKGRAVSSDAGVLEAAFAGNHGWYWRNRGQSSVKLILRTRGDYAEIKSML
ncbi:MAG: transmembrane anchor protein [Gammaproteobacteria bacterium]